MDPSTMSIRELMMYGPLLNAGIGIIFGLITLILGIAKRNLKYGVYGFLTCLVGGALFGLFLSVPALVFFLWLILRRPKTADAAEPPENDHEN